LPESVNAYWPEALWDDPTTVTVADVEKFAVPCIAEAVTMMFPPPVGGLEGAVKTPSAVIDPQAPGAVLLQLNENVTPVGAAPPLLLTVKVCCAPAFMVRLEGLMARLAPSETVTVAVADLVLSSAGMPVMVTVLGFGTVEGAVYRPVPSMIPMVLLPPMTPFTSQVTVDAEPLVTVAANC
jgi:hypothetical protein